MLQPGDKVSFNSIPPAVADQIERGKIYTIDSLDSEGKLVCLKELEFGERININCLALLCETCQRVPVYLHSKYRKCLFCLDKEAVLLAKEFIGTLTEKQRQCLERYRGVSRETAATFPCLDQG